MVSFGDSLGIMIMVQWHIMINHEDNEGHVGFQCKFAFVSFQRGIGH